MPRRELGLAAISKGSNCLCNMRVVSGIQFMIKCESQSAVIGIMNHDWEFQSMVPSEMQIAMAWYLKPYRKELVLHSAR